MDPHANCCNICWDVLDFEQELPAVLACDCQVIYHLHCIRFWLDRNNTCPMCRKNTYVVDVDSPQEEQQLQLQIIPMSQPIQTLVPVRTEESISFVAIFNNSSRSHRKCFQCNRISVGLKQQLIIGVGLIIFIIVIFIILLCGN
tara:strand:- start:1631 stop:2062 length:432 start_codon:yes stop_codon:yes gene_type:complete